MRRVRVGQRQVLEVALDELDVLDAGCGGVAPGEREHLVVMSRPTPGSVGLPTSPTRSSLLTGPTSRTFDADGGALSAALSPSGAATSLPVNATGKDIPSGTTLYLTAASGTATQAWTTTANAPAGSTSIKVTSQKANFAYPVDSVLQAPSLSGMNQIVYGEVQDNFPLQGTEKAQYVNPGSAGTPNVYSGSDINTKGGAGTAGCPFGQHAGVGCWQVPSSAGSVSYRMEPKTSAPCSSVSEVAGPQLQPKPFAAVCAAAA